MSEKQAAQTANPISKTSKTTAASDSDAGFPMLIPIAVTAFAVLIIGVSAIFVGVKVFGGNDKEVVYKADIYNDYEETSESSSTDEDNKNKTEKTPKPEKTPADNDNADNTNKIEEPVVINSGNTITIPKGKSIRRCRKTKKINILPPNPRRWRELSATRKANRFRLMPCRK